MLPSALESPEYIKWQQKIAAHLPSEYRFQLLGAHFPRRMHIARLAPDHLRRDRAFANVLAVHCSSCLTSCNLQMVQT